MDLTEYANPRYVDPDGHWDYYGEGDRIWVSGWLGGFDPNAIYQAMGLTPEQRVEKGGAWLLEREPEAAHSIIEAVESDAFCMSLGCSCAVGVALGEYHQHAPENVADSFAFGFLANSWDGYAQLEKVWAAWARREVEG